VCASLLPDEDFSGADDHVVEGDTILVGAGLGADYRRSAEQAHAGGSLEDVGGKGAALGIELDAKSSGRGDPLRLIGRCENDHIRKQTDDDALIGQNENLLRATEKQCANETENERGEDNTGERTLTDVGEKQSTRVVVEQ